MGGNGLVAKQLGLGGKMTRGEKQRWNNKEGNVSGAKRPFALKKDRF